VRYVHGIPISAAKGSAPAQNASMRMVRNMSP
jgi:hypothetical protein